MVCKRSEYTSKFMFCILFTYCTENEPNRHLKAEVRIELWFLYIITPLVTCKATMSIKNLTLTPSRGRQRSLVIIMFLPLYTKVAAINNFQRILWCNPITFPHTSDHMQRTWALYLMNSYVLADRAILLLQKHFLNQAVPYIFWSRKSHPCTNTNQAGW